MKEKNNENNNENKKDPGRCLKTIFKPILWMNDFASVTTSYASNLLFGATLGDAINLGQKSKLPEYEHLKEEFDMTLKNFNHEYPSLDCNDFLLEVNRKSTLQTMDIKNDANKENNYLVVFMGNGELLEGRIRRLAKMSIDMNCHIRAFNYRGKGESMGRAKKADDLIEDGISQVTDLMKKGIPAEKITLFGRCLGASIAVFVADKLHSKNQKVKVALGFPFSNISNMYMGILRLQKIPNKNVKNIRVKKILLDIYKPFIKELLISSKWEMDVKKAYQKIPEDYKMFFQIRSRDQMNRDGNQFGDGVVADEASLGYKLEKDILKEMDTYSSKIMKLEKKLCIIAKKAHKTVGDIDSINFLNHKITQCIKSKNDLKLDLLKLRKTEVKEDENQWNEDYSELANKQKCIGDIHKIDKILPKLLDITAELGEMRKSLSEKENDFCLNDLARVKNEKLTNELNHKFGARRGEIEKNLVDISYEIKGKVRKPKDPNTIDDIDMFAFYLTDYVINQLMTKVRYVMNMPELNLNECMNAMFENNGLAKLGHNKEMQDLHYVEDNTTVDIALKRFVNKSMTSKEFSLGDSHRTFDERFLP